MRGFNLTATLDIDPAFFTGPAVHDHRNTGDHDHDAQHAHGGDRHHPGHIDDVTSFVFRNERAFEPSRLERFFGSLVDEHGPRLLRYKGILHMHATARKVIFQGVHQLMSSDQGPKWAPDENRQSRIVFIGIDLPEDLIRRGLEDCLV